MSADTGPCGHAECVYLGQVWRDRGQDGRIHMDRMAESGRVTKFQEVLQFGA